MMNTTSPKRYFTVEDVNQRLPLMRAIVADIVALHATLSERRELLRRVRQPHSTTSRERDEDNLHEEELRDVERELEVGERQLQAFERELSQLGGELLDPATGWVEFPAMLDGREVCLSWKHGEEEIAFWHEVGAEPQQRKSLLEGMISHERRTEETEPGPADV